MNVEFVLVEMISIELTEVIVKARSVSNTDNVWTSLLMRLIDRWAKDKKNRPKCYTHAPYTWKEILNVSDGMNAGTPSQSSSTLHMCTHLRNLNLKKCKTIYPLVVDTTVHIRHVNRAKLEFLGYPTKIHSHTSLLSHCELGASGVAVDATVLPTQEDKCYGSQQFSSKSKPGSLQSGPIRVTYEIRGLG